MSKNPVQAEKERLTALYQGIPENRRKLLEGLIDDAARLRVRLAALWADLLEHGETELFTQSPNTPPYERERPAARLYNSTCNAYRHIIGQLDSILVECGCADDHDDLFDFERDFEREWAAEHPGED